MKRILIIGAAGLALILVTVAVCAHVTAANNNLDSRLIEAGPHFTTVATPAPTPAPTERVLTDSEQTFVDQACADAVNQKMYDSCKQTVIDSL